MAHDTIEILREHQEKDREIIRKAQVRAIGKKVIELWELLKDLEKI
jgi:hypothetical protein